MKTTKIRIIFFAIALTYNLILGFCLRDFLVLSPTLQVFYLLSALPTIDAFLIAVFIIITAVLLILLIVRIALGFNTFKRNIKYVNMEIRRTRGSERKAWQKEKRRLWLSLIPFHK